MKTNGLPLSPKVKELIAIGVSVGAHCDSCLHFHIQKATEAGANQDEIREAIGVGQQVERGAIAKMQKHIAQMEQAIL